MKSKSLRTRALSKLNASTLGACLTAGLSLAAVTPAHADIYNPYAGYIPYTYTDDNGRTVYDTAFRVYSYTWNRGWVPGFGTSNGEMPGIRMIKITQLRDSPKICVQVRKYHSNWSTPQEQCTNGSSGPTSEITVGDQDTNVIQVMNVRLKDCTDNDHLTANALNVMSIPVTSCSIWGCSTTNSTSSNWQEAITGEACSQKIKLGVPISHKYAPYMSAFDLAITRGSN